MITINKNDIKGITLLSIEEVRKLPRWLLVNGNYWWLRSPGDVYDFAAFVYDFGSVYSKGTYVSNDFLCVRPAIKINVRPSYLPLKIGDMVLVLGRKAQFIGNGMVLFCEPIGYHRFDEKSNNYEKSEIKDFIEEWLKEELAK